MTRLLSALTVVTVVFTAVPAMAGKKAAQEACANDATRFCAGAGKKRKAIRACLAEHRSELSDTCRMAIDKKGKTAKPAPKPDK